jgi:hypothetical protein
MKQIKDFDISDICKALEAGGLLNDPSEMELIGYAGFVESKQLHIFTIVFDDNNEGGFGGTEVIVQFDREGLITADFPGVPVVDFASEDVDDMRKVCEMYNQMRARNIELDNELNQLKK